jgi:hypothetical protein
MWFIFYVCGDNNYRDLLSTTCDLNEAIYIKKELELELVYPYRDCIILSRQFDWEIGR